MKITKLLVLGALLLMGNGVAMAADWIARTAPTVSDVKAEAVNFEADHEYLLYNTGAQMFFSQGNAWGTKASGDAHQEHALRMYFTKYVPTDGEWDGKTYIFNVYSSIRSTTYAWRKCFFDSDVAMFVDHASQPNLYWEIQDMGGATYRLKAAEANPSIKSDGTQFVGRDETVGHDDANLSDGIYDPEAQPLSPMLTEGEGKHIDWVFYDSSWLEDAIKVYQAAEAMRAEAEGAEAEGIDISAYVALYNSDATTVEEFENAIIELQEKRRDNIGNATADKPVNATSFIVNPDFANNSMSGWSGDAFGTVNAKNNAEHYNKTYNTYQEIEGLPNGVYAIGVNSFYRAGNAEPAYANYKANNADSRNAKLYAVAGVDTLMTSIVSPFKGAPTEKTGVGSESSVTDGDVTYWIPNNMEAGEYYMHTLGLYGNTVFNAVEDGALTIGVRKDATVGGDWTLFDDFSLIYYGNGADAYQKWFDTALGTLDIYGDQEITVNHTPKYSEEYKETFAELNGLKVSNKAEVIAALQTAENAADALTLNISLWAQFEALLKEAYEVAADQTLNPSYTEPLADWAEFDGPDALAALELTNEELQQIIDEKTAEIEEARKHPFGPGADMTNMLKNPGFTGNADGWTVNAVSGGNVAYGSNCFEAWNNASFDVYQVVEGAPKGIYEISVQGFYRYGRGKYQDYLNQEIDEVKPGKAPVYVYMNDNQTSFTNVYGDPVQITDATFYEGTAFESFAGEDGANYYFPSDMASGAIAFNNGMYTQSAYGVVANEGDVLRIGAKGNSSQLGDSWCIWDNFKLTFLGFDNAEIVQPILEKTLLTSNELIKSTMSKSAKAALQEAINNANASLGAGSGEAMFNALSALLTANTAANASIAIFAALETAVDNLAAAIVSAVAGKDVIAQAQALHADVLNKIESGSLEDSDVEELQKEIAAMIKKLAVPEEMGNASDANPVDCTSMIVNPDYDNGNNDGWTLDKNPGFNMGLIEVYNNNFDEYQVLEGLPEGTYTVTVQGFYRYGSTKNEYDSYQENPEANNYLTLYALVGEEEYAAAMPRLAKDGAEKHTSTKFTENEETGEKTFVAGDDLAEGDAWQWAWMTDPEISEDGLSATGIRIANGMIPVASLFNDGKFAGTEVTFVVGEDGTARIGLKKQEETNTDQSWCIWDNWKLTYYGPNSTKTPTETGIKDAADKATVVKTEFFNVNGVRINSAAKGIIIVKETLSNGTVKVKKVTVK